MRVYTLWGETLDWIEINEIKNNMWLRDISPGATVLYTHVFDAGEEEEREAEELGMSLYDYAVHRKTLEREELMIRAMEYDRKNPHAWMLVHTINNSNKFKRFECMEEILRELFHGQCDIYVEYRGFTRIIREEGVYSIYAITPSGEIRWEELLGKRKYDDYEMQMKYMIHSLFLYRGMLVNGGRKWYKGEKKYGKKGKKKEAD